MLSLLNKELWTKELVSWYLYDFANSFVYINATLYFSQWVVVDRGLTDFWFSLPFIVATIILILTSSLVGTKGDREGTHGKIFLRSTLLTLVSFGCMFLAAKFISGMPGLIISLTFFGVYQLGYLLSFVPYNAFIKFITNQEFYGAVSGIGLGFSELGNIAGLLLTLPIIQGSVTLFGKGRLATLPPALFAFALFSIPALVVFTNKPLPKSELTEPEAAWWKTFWSHLMESRKIPGVFPLLLGFYFFSDAILTVSLYSAIYLQKVFAVPDTTKVLISILVLVGFALGSFICGPLSDAFGHKRVLIYSLLVNGVSTVSIAAVSRVGALYPLFVLFGLASGGVYAASRSYLASLVPQEESGKFFGLYTFAERFASVIGPAVWGIVIILFAGMAPSNYRLAAGVMGVIALLGVVPLVHTRKEKVE